MDFVQINKFTQSKKVKSARDSLYNEKNLSKIDALILITASLKSLYGARLTAKIIYSLGVEKIDFSL